MKGFGSRLREFREARGLTQEDLAQAIGAHWTQISRYERDQQLPTADRVVAITKVLRVSSDSLLVGQRGNAGVQEIEFKNIRLYERFRVLDELPKQDQDVVLQLVDAVIAKRRMEAVIQGQPA